MMSDTEIFFSVAHPPFQRPFAPLRATRNCLTLGLNPSPERNVYDRRKFLPSSLALVSANAGFGDLLQRHLSAPEGGRSDSGATAMATSVALSPEIRMMPTPPRPGAVA